MNVMFIGDGKGKTVITGGKSVSQHLTTFHTASFGKILTPRCFVYFICHAYGNTP